NFFPQPVDMWPLHGLQSGGPSGTNGVYRYSGAAAFPNNSYNASNYWVDVVFNTTSQMPTATPTPTATSTSVPTNTPTPGPPTATPTATSTPVPANCPCTTFDSGTAPATTSSGSPVELGVKLRSDNSGY